MPAANDWKFRSAGESAERIIKSRELWFSTPQNFNDPFDCQVDIEGNFDTIRNRLQVQHNKQLSELIDEVERQATQERYGYFCTCCVWNETLMWSHYANSHNGLAFGFTFSKDSPFYSEDMKNRKVEYDSGALRKAIKNANDTLNMHRAYPHHYPGLMPEEADRFLEIFMHKCNKLYEAIRFMKAECWQYEEEHRYEIPLSSEQENGLARPFATNDLKHVIFGISCEVKTIERIRDLLTGAEWSHVRFWRATRDAVNLKVLADPLE